MLESGGLDCVAVTDHNTITFALALNEKIGNHIIVGEEITTLEGEIIGLYLTEVIKAGMTAAETVAAIKRQGGLVYIPHPFETVRQGVSLNTLNTIMNDVDIIEAQNGRAIFQNKSKPAIEWSQAHQKPGMASSDAHGWHGWGRTYTMIEAAPTRASLVSLLAKAEYRVASPGLRGVLYPKLNRIRRRRRA